jgi:hypothetical protein
LSLVPAIKKPHSLLSGVRVIYKAGFLIFVSSFESKRIAT